MADGSATWIAKPSITNQAIGICIFDRVSALRAALEAAEDMREWVVQRYYSSVQRFQHPRSHMADKLSLLVSSAPGPALCSSAQHLIACTLDETDDIVPGVIL